MVSNGIMSRRKRAQIGTIIAILLILVPLPVGAYLVGNMNDYGVQQRVFVLDDVPDDDIFEDSLVSYDNTSGTYTYSKYLSDDTLLANYTSDVAEAQIYYFNGSDSGFGSDLTVVDDTDQVFCMFQKEAGDADSTLTFKTDHSGYPVVGFLTSVSPVDLVDGGASKARVFFDNGQSDVNLTLWIGVYDENTVPDMYAAVGSVTSESMPATDSNYEIAGPVSFVSSANGSWVDVDLSSNMLLTAQSLHPDGYVFYTIVDDDGGVLDPNAGFYTTIEIYGPEKPYSFTSTWNACLIAIGMFSMVGAIVSTPYVSIESLTGDGMKGQRYRKGHNPKPNHGRGGNNKRGRGNNGQNKRRRR